MRHLLSSVSLLCLFQRRLCQVRLHPKYESIFSPRRRASSSVVPGAPVRLALVHFSHVAPHDRIFVYPPTQYRFLLSSPLHSIAAKHGNIQASTGLGTNQREVNPRANISSARAIISSTTMTSLPHTIAPSDTQSWCGRCSSPLSCIARHVCH